jgi:hypothetical protein
MPAIQSPVVRGLSITFMLVFGTCTVVIQKIIFNLKGKGRHNTEHTFEKPWFQTEAMFIGMFGCLGVYELMNLYKWYHSRDPAARKLLDEHKTDVQQTSSTSTKKAVPRWKQYLLVIAPATCDMVATAMMNISLVWSEQERTDFFFYQFF